MNFARLVIGHIKEKSRITMNNYELKIEPYKEDLSAVSDYLDCAEFQLLTQIAPYKNNNIWTALSVHGYGVNSSDIYKPGFARNDKKIDNQLQWTSLLNKPIMEPIREIIARLPCKFERIRFMNLAAGKSLRKHNDNIDPDIENKKIVRIHIPIRTNNEVVFTMYENDEDENGEKLNLKTGHFYYLDVTKPHSVSNNSSIDRYHLVVDCYVNEELKAIL
jgi:hypothetical protein